MNESARTGKAMVSEYLVSSVSLIHVSGEHYLILEPFLPTYHEKKKKKKMKKYSHH